MDEGAPEFTVWILRKGQSVAYATICTIASRREARFLVEKKARVREAYRGRFTVH